MVVERPSWTAVDHYSYSRSARVETKPVSANLLAERVYSVIIRVLTMDVPSVLSAGDSMVSDSDSPQPWGAGSTSPGRKVTVGG